MTATRIIDDHLELANIGTNSHAQIDTHIAAADDYVKRDGSLALTSDWDIGDTRKVLADEIRARDSAGLKLYDDGGNGIFIEDGGYVGIGTSNPTQKLNIVDLSTDSWIKPFLLHAPNVPVSKHVQIGFGQSETQYNQAELNFDYAGLDSINNVFSIRLHSAGLISLNGSGNFGVNTSAPTAKLDVNSDILRLQTAKTPATAGAAGNQGDICWDADYIYVCTATNTWERAAIAVW